MEYIGTYTYKGNKVKAERTSEVFTVTGKILKMAMQTTPKGRQLLKAIIVDAEGNETKVQTIGAHDYSYSRTEVDTYVFDTYPDLTDVYMLCDSKMITRDQFKKV